MPKTSRLALSLIAIALVAVPPTSRAPAAEIDYARDVKPLLVAKCHACHGALRAEGGLRLDTGRLARQGGDSGPAVVPGDLDASLLIERITAEDESVRMPAEARPLTREQIGILKSWIRTGAKSPAGEPVPIDPREHWAFQSPAEPQPSAGENTDVAATPVDRFIRRRLRAAGLQPAPAADRATLVRRLYLDMHGLPPAPEVVAEFIADPRDDAWARLVDRVLASPRYGERWAQHWLDVVRYADTHGYEVNTPREHAWPYRDWVIAAFNDDLPYDRFVFQQLAGDAVGADAATGFLVAAAVLLPGQIGADDESKRLARQDALDEIIVGTGATFLGLTIGCARCHDHKFDPLSQRDYYAMQAFFAGVDYGDRAIESPERRRRLDEAAQLAPTIDRLKSQVSAAWNGITRVGSAVRSAAEVPPGREIELQQLPAVVKQIKQLLAKKAKLEQPDYIYAGKFREPDNTRVLARGDPEQPQEPIAPRVPEILGTLALADDADEQQRRVALARWIASGENPLTARVIVNRVWQYHFGRGLVETPSDFGLSAEPPTHPELLDFLAVELVRGGWSIKRLQRMILLSATYRQSSRIDPAAARADADCRLLWRFPSRRIEAEAIRDSMLATSGQLNLQMGGPGYSFFKTRGGLSGFPPIERFGPSELRRMIYSHKIRMEPVPVFGAFDCPDAGQPMPRRGQSTTAIQALNLFNSPFVAEQSQAFAERVTREAGESIDDQVRQAYRLALGRRPENREIAACREVVAEHGLQTLCRVLFNSNEFLFIP